ncbi:carotenoid oxygenase family protein [Nostoc sp. TCL26-01]|uniref:carotenoid oxygenase family protein n=1 Tax=Nostoc sp. TCL26-01 TaxID=2576904 RepID=UPI0015BCBDDF|nr:carotenoid oxygenase family protein [Nostoc sp. TCL26-01]QLE58166.1 9-cis-epoxycarotenoid dioxygenase [Nostoc sp. TCL26-01]
MITTAISPYLQENFAPVKAEITVNNLPVIGELPPNLCGIFVRNGPNPQFPPLNRYNWIDGDGMLHGIQIRNGKAAYRDRFVQTRGFKMEQKTGRAIWTGLTELPQLNNPANNLFSPFKNTANTALVWHAGRLLALWEGGEPYEINLPDLDTIGPYNYQGQLSSAFTAHPKVDPVTGEMMFFGYSLLQRPYLKYSVVSAQGKIVKTVPIDLPVGVMIHDFAITENYTIFLDLPLTFRVERLQKREPGYMFEPDSPSRLGIIPRHGDSHSIRWFEIPTCYVVHTLNAYEMGEEVILIGCRADDAKALNIPNKTKLYHTQEDRPILYQWRLNLRTGLVEEEIIDDLPSEFPSLNQQWLGKQNRYGYTARMMPGATPDFTFDGLLKYDFMRNYSQSHDFGRGRYGGEAVFVPRPDGVEEDDGWLLTFVYDKAKNTSELLVVDAQYFTDEPVARILLPQRVPYGFHGIWIPQEF